MKLFMVATALISLGLLLQGSVFSYMESSSVIHQSHTGFDTGLALLALSVVMLVLKLSGGFGKLDWRVWDSGINEK